jgi:hypothetical protein
MPLLEAPGIHSFVEDGDVLRVNIKAGTIENLTSGKLLRGNPPAPFLLNMVESGGLIPLLQAGSFFEGMGK